MVKYCSVYKNFTLPDGSIKTVRFRGATRREAERKRDQAIRDFERGLFLISSKMTVARYAEQYAKTHDLSEDAARRLNTHIVANIGSIRVQDVRASHIELCLNAVRNTSASNINKTWILLRAFFRALLIDELIISNPMDKVDKPRGTTGRRRALNDYEQRIFHQTIAESMASPDTSRHKDLMFAVILGCGLRPGEVRALVWSNVYLDNKLCGWPFIRVSAAVKKGTTTIGSPKTEAGYRDVPIPDWLLARLKEYKKERSGALLFPATKDAVMNEQRFRIRWHSFLNRMDIMAGAKTYRNKIVQHSMIGQDLTAYYLRHTYRTMLMEAGVNSLVAAYWMGHSEAGVNDIGYAHITTKMLADAVALLNKIDKPADTIKYTASLKL